MVDNIIKCPEFFTGVPFSPRFTSIATRLVMQSANDPSWN